MYVCVHVVHLLAAYNNSILYHVFSHRHRRTETEEDEELISQAKKTAAVITRFEESPTCKF